MAHTVADQLWQMLGDAGVRRCYGIVGDALNPVIDALRRSGRVEFIHVRHEEYGTFAAACEAQLTGGPAAVCGTAGPGVAHLVNGLLDAKHEGAPVIAIAGDVERGIMDTGALEELNPYQFFQTASLYTGRIVQADQARAVIDQAITTALLEGGPTVISLPGDVAREPATKSHYAPPRLDATPPPASEADLAAMAELIGRSRKITIMGGHGCRDGAPAVARLAERLAAPVAYSFRGKQWLEHATANAVGMTGLLGWGGAYDALHSADLVLMLGCDFPFRGFLPTDVPYIQVDKDPRHLGRRVPIRLGVVGDVGQTVAALLPRLPARARADTAHLDEHVRATERWRRKVARYVERGPQIKPIRPEFLAAVISDLADDDALFFADTGTPCMWAARNVAAGRDRRFMGSLTWSSMASAAPYGFGAALSAPGRQAIALCGDGGFTMLGLGDLITQVRHRARVVNVIFNNGQLDFVNIEQQEAGFVPFGTDLPNPDLAAVATALGARGIRVEDPGDVRGAVAEALAHPSGPVVLDVVVDPAALAMPSHLPKPTVEGFTLSVLKRGFGGDLPGLVHEAADNARIV
ncbi:MAG: ubiquinone-dependent pyruvate dehydrogenase [Bifidobacteriaceae bacterium]|jgi:pyruvate dehydrogenase (quinone)|nr:ubiquinone-dependent pyruvate dehydrogenase [Bifidobacteriaceae bacterium]